MATSTEPQTKRQYVDFDEYIDYQLQKTRSSIKWTDVLTAGAAVATFLLGYLFVFTVLDHWVVPGGFGRLSRTVMFTGIVLLSGGWLVWKLVIPYLKQVSRLYAAWEIERSHPELKSTLLNLVDLQGTGREVPVSIRSALEKRAAVSLSRMDLEHVVDRRALMRFSYALLAVVVLICLYTLFSPKKLSFSRALMPATEVSVPTQTEILEVDPGDAEVVARTHLQVTADLRGKMPDEVTLLFTTADRKFLDEPIEMREVDGGVKQYRAMIDGENGRGILQNMSYRIVAGDAQSPEYRIVVMQPPSASVEHVNYEYPSYMELPPQKRPGGQIDTWEGTEVTVTAKTNIPVTSALMVFSDAEDTQVQAEEVPMEITGGTTLRGRWKAEFRSDGTFPRHYRIECKNDKGQSDPEPTLYSIDIRLDQPPEITLLDPVRDLERPANAVIPLMLQARDPDFRLRYLRLHIEKNGEEIEGPFLFEGNQQSVSLGYDWRLAPLGLQPGDAVTFWVEARDNRQPFGNAKTTPRLNVDIVQPESEEEVRERLQADRQRQQNMIENARQETVQPGENSQQQRGSGTNVDGTSAEDGAAPTDPESGNENRDSESPEPAGQQQDGPQVPRDPEGGAGESSREQFSPEGPDDAEVLRKLIQRNERQNQPGDVDRPQPQQRPDQQQPQDQDRGPEQPGTQAPGGEGGKQGEAPPQDGQGKGSESGTGEKQPGQQDGTQPAQPQPQPRAGDPATPEAAEQQPASADKSGSKRDETSGGPAAGQPDKGGDDTDRNAETRPGGSGGDRKRADGPLDGTPRPADEPPGDARRQKATGNETGQGRPDTDPNADPTPANNDVKRKPGEKPALPDKSKGDPSAAKEPVPDGKAPPAAEPKPAGGSSDASTPDMRPAESTDDAASKAPTESKRTGSQELAPKGTPRREPAEQRDDRAPSSVDPGDDGARGPTKPKSPGSGDRPTKTANAETKPGEADNLGKDGEDPGGQSDSPARDARPDDSPAPQDGPENGKPERRDGPPRDAQPRPGQQANEPRGGASTGRQPAGQRNAREGRERGGAPTAEQVAEGEGGPAAPGAEEANLEYNKQATNMVLEKLDDELKRGDVDEQLLEELGWTEDDLKKFVDRLQRQLDDAGEDRSPESQARRRQFEEMLKSLNLRSAGSRRRGASDRESSQAGFGPRRLPVPAEYRLDWEAYTRDLSKRSGRQDD